MMGPSMHRQELEPCYSCPHGARIAHDIGGVFVGESVACHCPEKIHGQCTCSESSVDVVPILPLIEKENPQGGC